MNDISLLEFRLTGENISPPTFRLRDLADILKSMEQMVAYTVVENFPHLSISEDTIVIGLVDVQPGSVALTFKPQLPNYVIPAYEQITQAIASQNYHKTSPRVRKLINKVSDVVRGRQCDLELRWINEQKISELLAVIKPETIIETLPNVYEDATIYGEILRVGGKGSSTVMLGLDDGHAIICNARRDVAKQLAPKLYETVGLTGSAEISLEDFSLVSFTIESIIDYVEKPISQAFQEFRFAFSNIFEDVDAEEYVNSVRGEDY